MARFTTARGVLALDDTEPVRDARTGEELRAGDCTPARPVIVRERIEMRSRKHAIETVVRETRATRDFDDWRGHERALALHAARDARDAQPIATTLPSRDPTPPFAPCGPALGPACVRNVVVTQRANELSISYETDRAWTESSVLAEQLVETTALVLESRGEYVTRNGYTLTLASAERATCARRIVSKIAARFQAAVRYV